MDVHTWIYKWIYKWGFEAIHNLVGAYSASLSEVDTVRLDHAPGIRPGVSCDQLPSILPQGLGISF